MEWTADQINAMNIIVDNYRQGRRFTFISGVAGSGKTTLLLESLYRLGIDLSAVRCLSYTGKASQVLAAKGLPNVSTIHSFLYYPVVNEYGTVITWRIKPHKNFEGIEILLVDEVSMVPYSLWVDLMTLGIHVICTGDIEQLPPVKSTELINWKALYRGRPCYSDDSIACDYHMTEITRQSEDSDIIRQSLLIRNQGAKAFLSQSGYKSDNVSLIKLKDVTPELLLEQDVIITATNHKRKMFNQVIRGLIFPQLSEEEIARPQNSDIIICLANNWERENLNGQAIVNGLRGRIDDIQVNQSKAKSDIPLYRMKVDFYANETRESTPDVYNVFSQLAINYHDLINQELSDTQYNKIGAPLRVDYGYAISCHKAQGSEWDKVMIIEEGFPTGKTRDKWWYTALTRAKSKVTVVRSPLLGGC